MTATQTSTADGKDNFLYGFQINGFTSSYSISAQTDGAVTESLGIAGIDLIVIPSGAASKDAMVRPGPSVGLGVFRRQDCSITKTNLVNGALGTTVSKYNRLQSASINVDIGREDLLEMGRKGPYIRYASFPVEVTCDLEYNIDTGKDGVNGGNFQDGKGSEDGHGEQGMLGIDSDSNCGVSDSSVIAINGSRRVQTGPSDFLTCTNGVEGGGVLHAMFAAVSGAKLQSQSWSGGDTGGGVVTVSESYTSFNALRVHSGMSASITANAATAAAVSTAVDG
jgi:hypothetical protein